MEVQHREYNQYTSWGKHLMMYVIIESLCCTSQTNIILCINFIPIKKTISISPLDLSPMKQWLCSSHHSIGPETVQNLRNTHTQNK